MTRQFTWILDAYTVGGWRQGVGWKAAPNAGRYTERMCGRYVLIDGEMVWVRELTGQLPLFPPRYDIAPQQTAPIIRVKDEVPTFEELRWGFRPAWMKDRNKAQINARAETVFEKPMFKHSALHRRCLVLANGWYEWQKTATGKQPFAFHLKDDALFAFAGIWTRWHADGEESQDSDSYAIITTVANPLAAPVHNRMPVILNAGDCAVWLDPADSDAARLASLLAPYGRDDLNAYPVGTYVNSPQHDGRQCLEPLSQ